MPHDKHRIARALADGIYSTDQQAADRYNVCLRTIYRWKTYLAEDKHLQRLLNYYIQMNLKERDTTLIDDSINACVAYIREFATYAKRTDPTAAMIIIKSMESLAGIRAMDRYLDAQLASATKENHVLGQADGEESEEIEE